MDTETRYDPCAMVTLEQAEAMLEEIKLSTDTGRDELAHRRKKRKFDSGAASRKWEMPIKYKFNGEHCELMPKNI